MILVRDLLSRLVISYVLLRNGFVIVEKNYN